MRPIKTVDTPDVYRGNGEEILDLPCKIERSQRTGDQAAVFSVWEPDEDERRIIAEGGNITLGIYWPFRIPPVSVAVTGESEVEI